MSRNLIRSVFGVLTLAVFVLGMVAGSAFAGDVKKPPAVGDEAKDFDLVALGGEKVKLSKLVEKGPVVLVVLRGYPGY